MKKAVLLSLAVAVGLASATIAQTLVYSNYGAVLAAGTQTLTKDGGCPGKDVIDVQSNATLDLRGVTLVGDYGVVHLFGPRATLKNGVIETGDNSNVMNNEGYGEVSGDANGGRRGTGKNTCVGGNKGHAQQSASGVSGTATTMHGHEVKESHCVDLSNDHYDYTTWLNNLFPPAGPACIR